VYVAVNVKSVLYRVCVLEICVCGCKYREGALYGLCTGNWCMWLQMKRVCFIGCVYWKLVYVAVNVESVPYRVCVQEIGVCGFKCRECAL